MTTFSPWDIQERESDFRQYIEKNDWHKITRPGDQSFHIRVGTAIDGQYVITGLLLGGVDAPAEITGQTLRSIKISEILNTIFWRETGSPPPRSVGDIGPTGLARFEGMTEGVAASAHDLSIESASGRRGPTQVDLTSFAAEYEAQRKVNPHRAMSTAARHCGISRATANRWAARAKELGLLSDPTSTNEGARNE